MAEDINEILANVAINTIKQKAVQKTLIEVLVESGMITEDQFYERAEAMFEKIKEKEFKEILDLSDEEAEEYSKSFKGE